MPNIFQLFGIRAGDLGDEYKRRIKLRNAREARQRQTQRFRTHIDARTLSEGEDRMHQYPHPQYGGRNTRVERLKDGRYRIHFDYIDTKNETVGGI